MERCIGVEWEQICDVSLLKNQVIKVFYSYLKSKIVEHDATNRCINTSHIVKIKFRLQCDLIELQGGYLGTIHMEASILHF